MYIHDILFKIISIGSCAPFYKKNLSGLEAFPDVILQGRHFKLLCRLSIHLKQQIEGFGGSFLHFHVKLMFTRCSVFEIKHHRGKFKGKGYEKNIYNTRHYVKQRSVVWQATVGSQCDSFLLCSWYHKNDIPMFRLKDTLFRQLICKNKIVFRKDIFTLFQLYSYELKF